MGCEAHPDTGERIFRCSGDLAVVFDPYFVGANKVEYPHWNGAPAFPREGDPETQALSTDQTELTDVPGRLQMRQPIGTVVLELITREAA